MKSRMNVDCGGSIRMVGDLAKIIIKQKNMRENNVGTK